MGLVVEQALCFDACQATAGCFTSVINISNRHEAKRFMPRYTPLFSRTIIVDVRKSIDRLKRDLNTNNTILTIYRNRDNIPNYIETRTISFPYNREEIEKGIV